MVFLICSHLDLKKSHFDSINCLPDANRAPINFWELEKKVEEDSMTKTSYKDSICRSQIQSS
jgi:hypothetical protein